MQNMKEQLGSMEDKSRDSKICLTETLEDNSGNGGKGTVDL